MIYIKPFYSEKIYKISCNKKNQDMVLFQKNKFDKSNL